MQEGIISLLNIDEQLTSTLFDFTEPWEVDILEFINDNYVYEFSMKGLANYTGRTKHDLKNK